MLSELFPEVLQTIVFEYLILPKQITVKAACGMKVMLHSVTVPTYREQVLNREEVFYIYHGFFMESRNGIQLYEIEDSKSSHFVLHGWQQMWIPE